MSIAKKQLIGQIPATEFSDLQALSAKVTIRTRNDDIQLVNILADTPAYWTIKNGVVRESGGKVADALDLAAKNAEANRLSAYRSFSFVDGVLHIDSVRVDLPEQPEELIVELPANYAGQLHLLSYVVSVIKLEAGLALGAILTANAQVRGQIQLCKQVGLRSARITTSENGCIIGQDLSVLFGLLFVEANHSSRIDLGGLLTVTELTIRADRSAAVGVGNLWCATGDLSLTANQNGTVKALFCHAGKKLIAKSSQTGRIEADNLSAVDSVIVEASQNGGVKAGKIQGKEAELKATQNGEVETSVLEVTSLTASASMSGSITAKAGSAQSGTAKASMSGDVVLRGSFASISKKQSMGGSVTIK
ncbi:MAG: hypothetical protein K2W82_16925 [Candidatus Obscuribacterales bacterium]|nr:hypothetical protein [Candidatus Obscuribacterales bacterium]